LLTWFCFCCCLGFFLFLFHLYIDIAHSQELCALTNLQLLDIAGNLSMNDRDLDCLSKLGMMSV
jgi:hypothetical protein